MKNKESLVTTGYIILLFTNFLLVANLQTKFSLGSELLLFFLLIVFLSLKFYGFDSSEKLNAGIRFIYVRTSKKNKGDSINKN